LKSEMNSWKLNMKKEILIIIGASGHGKVVADIALAMKQWQSIAFLDDDPSKQHELKWPFYGKVSEAQQFLKNSDFIVAIGNNAIREKIQRDLSALGATIATLIHPNAVIGSDVTIGTGSVVMAGVVINCGTTIGKGCIVNTGATLDHDNQLGDFVHISPGTHMAGTVTVGEKSWLGIGSVVINNVAICSHCLIGAGAVVVKDITEPGTYVGVPAKKM